MLLLWTLLCGLGAALALVAEHVALPHWHRTVRAYVLGTATLLAVDALWAVLAPISTPPLVTVGACAVIAVVGGTAVLGVYGYEASRGQG